MELQGLSQAVRFQDDKEHKMTNIDQLKTALELSRDGDWDSAHTIVQGIETTDSYRLHAYLHRKEGGLGEIQTNIL